VDRRAKVELFEQIRREYEHGGGTIRGIAKKWGFIGAWCVRREPQTRTKYPYDAVAFGEIIKVDIMMSSLRSSRCANHSFT